MLHELFPVIVYETEFTGELLEKVQKELQQEYALQVFIPCKPLTEHSEIGSINLTSGTFTEVNNFVNDDQKFPILKNEILKIVDYYCEQANIKKEVKPVISKSWFVLSQHNDYAHKHNHKKEDLTLVYYCQASGCEGKIKLHSPHSNFKYTSDDTYEITPTTGKIIIFPGWLFHSILTNETQNDRISVAIEVTIFNKYET